MLSLRLSLVACMDNPLRSFPLALTTRAHAEGITGLSYIRWGMTIWIDFNAVDTICYVKSLVFDNRLSGKGEIIFRSISDVVLCSPDFKIIEYLTAAH